MSTPQNLPHGLEPAQKIAGGVRVAPHSDHKPSEDKPKEGSLAAKMAEKHEQALVAQNAKALSDQLFEVDSQQRQQHSGNGKGVASDFHPHHSKHSDNHSKHRANASHTGHINQPGGAQACHKHGL